MHRELATAFGRIARSPYVQAARGRGEPVWPHLTLNALLPVLELIAGRAAFFVSGLIVIEKLMLLGGLGSILWEAAQLRDYPLAIGISLLATGWVAGIQLLCDTGRIALDPRLSGEPP
jgi:ABC-type dipeptide/oligopeptide/nickel transport system permease component